MCLALRISELKFRSKERTPKPESELGAFEPQPRGGPLILEE
jgi:hypothetical protein